MTTPIRILLVEDDAEDALLFRRHCPPRFLVQCVGSVEAALDVLHQSGFDVCYADYRLGVLSGLDLVRRIREAAMNLPVVLMSGQGVDSLGENALLAGAADFMSKDDLNAQRIGQVTRWVMIRNHVQTRPRMERFDKVNAEELLGAPARVRDPAERVRRVVYLSRASRVLGDREVLGMCGRFATANALTGITGALAHLGNRFLQVIEGDATAVECLMHRIARDPRHGEIVIVLDESAQCRTTTGWNMACLFQAEHYPMSPSQLDGLRARTLEMMSEGRPRRDALVDLFAALPEWLRQARRQIVA